MLKGVDLALGTYHLVREDVHRPGLGGGLSLVRTHTNAGEMGLQGLGQGWSFNYEVTLKYMADCQMWFASDIGGSAYEFDGNLKPFAGYHGSLAEINGSYSLKTKQGDVYTFSPAGTSEPNLYTLASIEDPFHNKITLNWAHIQDASQGNRWVDQVTKVTDAAGRTLTFDYQVGRAVVTCSDGAKLVYLKDTNGSLVVFQRYQAEALLQTELYGYSQQGAQRGNLVFFVDADNHRTDIAYYSDGPDEAGYASAKGNPLVPVAVSPKYRHVETVSESAGLDLTTFSYNLSGVTASAGSTMGAYASNGLAEITQYTIGTEGQPEKVQDACEDGEHATSMAWNMDDAVKTDETDALGRLTHYDYSASDGSAGDPTAITISQAACPYPLLDGSGQPIGTVTTARTYDSQWHRLNYEKTPDGIATTYTIDQSNGSVTRKLEEGGGLSRHEDYTYSGQGNLLSKTDFMGGLTDYSSYDALGNAGHIDFPQADGSHRTSVDRVFDARGRKTGETSSQGRAETWTYDDWDRVTAHTVHDGSGATADFEETWTYTDGGLLLSHADSAGLSESYGYDTIGRKTDLSVTTSAGDSSTVTYSTHWDYDLAGRIARRTDPDGVEHDFTYDSCGRETGESVTYGAVQGKPVLHQDLDYAGNVLRRTDHRGATTAFAYDALYRKHAETAPQVVCSASGTQCTPTKTWNYDLAGRVTQEIDPLGNVHAFIYDGLGRASQETWPLGHSVNRTGIDLLDRVTDETKSPEGLTVHKVYDALGRVTSETRTIAGDSNSPYTTATVYDDGANTMAMTDPNGNHALTQLDSLGHAKSVTLDSGGLNLTRSFTYDGHGKPATETDPNTNTTTYAFDGLGRKVRERSPPLALDGGSTGEAVRTWAYDFAGRVVREMDADGVYTTHAYDVLGREAWRTIAGDTVSTWTYHDGLGADPAVTETDGNQKPVLHSLDALGRETATTDQEGKKASFVFDANGRKVQSTDRESKVQRFEHDALGRLTKTTWVGGATGTGADLLESVAYDDTARTVTTTDRIGYLHAVASDAAGRKVKETKSDTVAGDPDSGKSLVTGLWSYDGLDHVVTFTDANQNVTGYAYDAAGRKSSETLDGVKTAYTYDKMDHMVQSWACQGPACPVDQGHLLKTYAYDAGYRLMTEQNAGGPVVTYGYDLAGNKLSVTDGLGKKTAFTYDARRRLTGVLDPVNTQTLYTYDGNNNRLAMSVASAAKLRWTYTDTNRLATEQRGSSGPLTTYAYNNEGDRVSITDGNRQSFAYTPDALGREARAIYPAGSAPPGTLKFIDRAFDNLDHPASVVQTLSGSGQSPDATQARALRWDYLGRQSDETDAHGTLLHFDYDGNGNRLKTTVTLFGGTGRQITYAYDARNRLKSVLDETGLTAYTYVYWGNLVDSVTRPDGSTESYTYDGADRLASKSAKDSGGNVIVSYAYEYDAANRRTKQTETHGSASEETDYTYYDDGALETVTYADGTSVTYDYDSFGNRLQETASQGSTVQSTKKYTYNDLDQLTGLSDGTNTTTYTYDDNGNQIAKADGTGTTTFAYTSRDMLSQVTVGTASTYFAYDDLGRRIQKAAPSLTEYCVWDGRSLAAELDAQSPGAFLRSYTHGLDLIRESLNGTIVEAYTDALGSVGAIAPEHHPQNAEHYWYAPFGNFRTESHPGGDCGGTENTLTCQAPYTFTGHLYDQESGLFYFGARYYDPETGRFLSQDPVAGDALNPPSLHKYLYAYSSPMNYTDPWGETTDEALGEQANLAESPTPEETPRYSKAA